MMLSTIYDVLYNLHKKSKNERSSQGHHLHEERKSTQMDTQAGGDWVWQLEVEM